MNVSTCARTILLCSILIPSYSTAWSVKGIYSSFFPKVQKEVVQQQFELSENGVLELHNIVGNISVQTRDHGVIVMEAIKKGKKEEDLATLDMHAEARPDKVVIQSISRNKKPKGSIDYNLIVPTGTALHLSTHTGNIHLKNIDGNAKILIGAAGNVTTNNTRGTLLVDAQRGSVSIQQAHGPIKARMFAGPITINNANHTIIAETVKSGAIKIVNAHGTIRTKTSNGNISILPACGDVIATSLRGNIDVLCKDLSPTSKVAVGSTSGAISIRLPKKINAYVDAQTEKGKLTSDLPITLKTKTTKLNSQAWSEFRRKVEGRIGSEDKDYVSVQLRSVKSNIKILSV